MPNPVASGQVGLSQMASGTMDAERLPTVYRQVCDALAEFGLPQNVPRVEGDR